MSYDPKKAEELNKLTKDLFNVINENDVLAVAGKNMYYQGQVVSAKDKQAIIEGAGGLKNNYVLKLILNEMKLLSNELMFRKAKEFDDMIGGKWILYAVDIIEKKITNLSKLG